jgi:hypothetical protein
MSAIRSQGVACAAFLLLAFTVSASAHAAPLDPLDFASLGTLNLSAGNFTIDTDAMTIVDDANPGTPLFTGVADDQNGAADFLNGNWVPSSAGIPEIAVFTFDDINLGAGATLSVVGNRALALLSQSDLVVATDLRLDTKQVALTIDPGSGGFRGGLLGPLGPGEGPGGGPSKGLLGATGGFGGSGAPATDNTGQVISAPGASYGDLRAVLQGGSGGASGFYLTALNYYRLEAGRFEDFVSYGLKSFAHEEVTLNVWSPSLGSVPSWPRIYSAIASSVTLPLDATK